MDKKKYPDDMRGFEEFIEAEQDKSFMGKPMGGQKKDAGFENFTFLTNDGERLLKIKNLMTEKLPFAARHEQGQAILNIQAQEIRELREKIFLISDKADSPFRKSLGEIFNSYFKSTEG